MNWTDSESDDEFMLSFSCNAFCIPMQNFAKIRTYFFVYSTKGSFTLKMTKVVLTVKKPTKSIESKEITQL